MEIPTSGDRVAVLLATYNGATHIESQIQSILAQTHSNFRLFVRDDKSTDQTVKITRELAKFDSRIVLVDNETDIGTGSAAANFFNLLCRLDFTDFSYFCFSDQDDIWAPEKISRALICLKNDGAHGYSSNMVAFDFAGKRAWYIKKDQAQVDLDYLFQGASAGCTYVIDKHLANIVVRYLEKILPIFPKKNSHDWIVYAIARSHGLKWHMDTHGPIFYRQHPKNLYGAKRGLNLLRAKVELFASGWYRNHVLWNLQILSGTVKEIEVFEHIRADRLVDRLWLVQHRKRFRRSKAEQLLFAAAIISGIFSSRK